MSFAQEEIIELFKETQEDYADAAKGELIVRRNRGCVGIGNSGALPGGFHIFSAEGSSSGPKSPQRKAYNRAFTTKALHEQIKARILAGERPKTGGRGRPPTRWWRVADELGIDIGQPKVML